MIQEFLNLKSSDFKSARKFAVQFVYQQDVNQQMFLQESTLKQFMLQSEVPENQKEFLKVILTEVFSSIQELDGLIEKFARNWKISRISKVDLAILRVATVEILRRLDIDPPIILSEAAALAQEFGSAQSVAFVNGILDTLAKDVRKKV